MSTGESGPGTFDAINPASGAVSWSVSEPASNTIYDMNCTVPIANNLAFLDGAASLTAVNVVTHATAWTITGAFKGTPAVNNSRVYVLSGSTVKVLNASTGATISTLDTKDTGLTGQPVLAKDSLVVSSSTKTYLISLQPLALVQTIPYGGPISVAGGNLYLAGSDGTLRVYHSSAENLNFAYNGAVGLASSGYTATGQTLNATLGFVPKAGTVLTVINNTGSSPISGTFSNLANGGTISLAYQGVDYLFIANYSGGGGNNLTLTYSSTPAHAPIITNGPPPALAYTTGNYSFTYTDAGSPPSTFSVTSGSLPPGLTLSTTGVLSGTPTRWAAIPAPSQRQMASAPPPRRISPSLFGRLSRR